MMCFVIDADWYASVVEETTDVVPPDAEKLPRCHECGRTIKPGQPMHRTFMQEHDECHRCFGGDDECDCGAAKDEWGQCVECLCKEPAMGETFHYARCDECDLFLQAVEASELEAGCHRNEARPGLQSMIEDLHEGNDYDNREARRYFRKAITMFPELVACGYLAGLWRRIYWRPS